MSAHGLPCIVPDWTARRQPEGMIMRKLHSVAVEMAIVTLTIVVLAGCGGMSRRGTDTVIGAGVGGVAGAVLTGGSALGTVGGAAVGGVVGNQVGK
ncbi:glycine zipper 2TM domain-containing protein [Burkholderia sp. LA-2-3-30-S1-D2]|uniref:glycine zipper 2TM domain-containing protein n=1 Tax=Burkholderia sp. LA-2-3-30-S1-D2 TaxID=1637862 RepID=UPI0030034FEF